MSPRRAFAGAALCLVGSIAAADLADEHFDVKGRPVWITVVENAEIMTAGKNADEKVQVLSGADIEIVGLADDPDTIALLGVPAIVAVTSGTQTCDELSGTPRAYFVIWWGEEVATDGPLTTCAELTLSFSSGALILEADPEGGSGEFWAWAPGKGWGSRLD